MKSNFIIWFSMFLFISCNRNSISKKDSTKVNGYFFEQNSVNSNITDTDSLSLNEGENYLIFVVNNKLKTLPKCIFQIIIKRDEKLIIKESFGILEKEISKYKKDDILNLEYKMSIDSFILHGRKINWIDGKSIVDYDIPFENNVTKMSQSLHLLKKCGTLYRFRYTDLLEDHKQIEYLFLKDFWIVEYIYPDSDDFTTVLCYKLKYFNNNFVDLKSCD